LRDTSAWTLEDWQDAFDEEAARLEYDEGVRPRLKAEALARTHIRELGGPANKMKTRPSGSQLAVK
jgi:hypothetical protein